MFNIVYSLEDILLAARISFLLTIFVPKVRKKLPILIIIINNNEKNIWCGTKLNNAYAIVKVCNQTKRQISLKNQQFTVIDYS